MIISILKITGIILLAVLGILLAVLAYVLIAPITYRGRVYGREAFGLRVDVYDVLRLARFSFIYEKGGARNELALLWGLISGTHNEEEEAPDEKADEPEPLKETSPVTVEEAPGAEPRPKPEPKPKPVRDEEKVQKEERPFEEPDQNMREPREPIEPEPVGSGELPEREPGRMEMAADLISDPCNQRAIKLLIGGGLSLLYRARPHFKGADITFSTGSPDTTGQLTGALSLCAGVYDENVRLIPDFCDEKPYFKGWADVYGRLSLIFAVAFLVRVVASRDCRRLYRQIRRS